MCCGKPLQIEEQEYCTDCRSRKHAFEQGRSIWLHREPVTHGIYQFKFHNKRYYAGVFAAEMKEQYEQWILNNKIEVIIPVPLHSSKRRQRGYNQAELLAKELGKQMGIPVNCEVVYRIRKTEPQKKLNHAERYRNLKGAFGVSRLWKPCKNVLLIDDIYTTGNTIQRIAKVLRKAGVQKVFFLTISIGQGL